MRTVILLAIITIALLKANAQSSTEFSQGLVSYISSQNIYVKFENTAGIQIGDTLFTQTDGKLKAAILITNKSSISCVGLPLNGFVAEINKAIVAKTTLQKPTIEALAQKSKTAIAVTDVAIAKSTEKAVSVNKKQDIDGKIAFTSYTNTSSDGGNTQRFRYNASLQADHIADSNLSAETYLSFTHKLGSWNGVSDALRVYSLSVKYAISKTASVSVGRKINLNMANIGAVDGLQFENNGRNFSYGALVGFRPDTYNYGFNSKLLQYGAYVGHKLQTQTGFMQTSLGLINQTNNGNTDRRFAYIQHSNSLLKNVDLFCSIEMDLYGIVNNQLSSTFDLTSTYVSLRYKPFKQLALSLSYDARKNLYYYETFKNMADSIFDRETRQGLRFQTTYHPFKPLVIGATAGYRLATANAEKSLNAYSYVTYNNVPWLNMSATANYTLLRTTYVNGVIYGGNLSRDMYKGKVYTDLSYRYINYKFINPAPDLNQHIAELSLSWRILQKLILSADIEAAYESNNTCSSRLYFNIAQRF